MSQPTDHEKMMQALPTAIAGLDIVRCYFESPHRSTKHSSYFAVYQQLLERFRDKPMTFIEVGVLDGGSLFMWREFFGPKARIIGIDFNPGAVKWKEHGFEIFIGDQSDRGFWKSLFDQVGDVDVVLDDGGHTYEQQIVTADVCIPRIKEGGMLIVEDTHTSYFKNFGYPSKYTFIEWAKHLTDYINSRSSSVKVNSLAYRERVFSISFFESMVCFHINPSLCFEGVQTLNHGAHQNAEYYTYKGTAAGSLADATFALARRLKVLKTVPGLEVRLRALHAFIFHGVHRLYNSAKAKSLKRYF